MAASLLLLPHRAAGRLSLVVRPQCVSMRAAPASSSQPWAARGKPCKSTPAYCQASSAGAGERGVEASPRIDIPLGKFASSNPVELEWTHALAGRVGCVAAVRQRRC